MPNLHNNIIDKDTHYLETIHYKYFSIEKKKCDAKFLLNNFNNKKYSQYEIYLTYDGLLKVLFS